MVLKGARSGHEERWNCLHSTHHGFLLATMSKASQPELKKVSAVPASGQLSTLCAYYLRS